MKKFKVIVKEFNRKDGGKFVKISAKGKYLPLVECEEETEYNVRFVASGIIAPSKSGIYAVACEDDGLWLDNRAGMEEKHIVRVRATRVMFEKNLAPKTEKPSSTTSETPF